MAYDSHEILPENYLNGPPHAIESNLTQLIFDLSRTRDQVTFKIFDPINDQFTIRTLADIFSENNIPEEISNPDNSDVQKQICEILKKFLFKDNQNFDAQTAFAAVAKFFHQGNLFLMPQGLMNQQLHGIECAFVKPHLPEQKKAMFQQTLTISADSSSTPLKPIINVQQFFRCSAPICKQGEPEHVYFTDPGLSVKTNHQIELVNKGGTIQARPICKSYLIHSTDPMLNAYLNRTKENSALVTSEFNDYLRTGQSSHSPPTL